MGLTNEPPDLLPGTLDLLILRSLLRGAIHGYGIAQHIRTHSDGVLEVGESSLYPALQRLEEKGWVDSEWRATDQNRRAKYYELTAAGRKQLREKEATWDEMTGAVAAILKSS